MPWRPGAIRQRCPQATQRILSPSARHNEPTVVWRPSTSASVSLAARGCVGRGSRSGSDSWLKVRNYVLHKAAQELKPVSRSACLLSKPELFMELLWNSYGTPMELLWNPYGIPMESLWNITLTTPDQPAIHRLSSGFQVAGGSAPGLSSACTPSASKVGRALHARREIPDAVCAPWPTRPGATGQLSPRRHKPSPYAGRPSPRKS